MNVNYKAGMHVNYEDIVRYAVYPCIGNDVMLITLPDKTATIIDVDDHEIIYDPTDNTNQLARNIKSCSHCDMNTAQLFAEHMLTE